MRWFYIARMGLQSLVSRRTLDDQIREDLGFHLEQATAEYIREGLSADDARRAALQAFGNPTHVIEDIRDLSLWTWWDRLVQDLRYAVRGFRRTPVFATTAVLSLALGIGANTAAFSIFNTLVLRPLPVRDPDTLFQVLHRGDAGATGSATYALYEHVKANATTIAGALLVDPTSTLRVVVDGQAEAVVGQTVTGDYFDVLGVRPVLGRAIERRDEHGAPPDRVAVIGHAYWSRRFARDPGVLGKSVTIDGEPYTIVGVAPPEFFGVQVGRRVDVSVPIDGSEERTYWKSRALMVRIAPGASRDTAEADLNVAFQQYLADNPMPAATRARSFKSLELERSSAGLGEFRDRYGRPVNALIAIVALLLLLACANLASLYLARAAARQRDVSVCLALGASRMRLTRQALSETLLLSAAGGLVGLLAASWGVAAVAQVVPGSGAPTDLQIAADRNVLLFGLAATVLTGVAIGLAPVWLARRVDIRTMLSAGGRHVAPASPFKALIVVQVALSAVLVVAAALFGVSLANLRTEPLGFNADGVFTVTVDADGTGLEGARLGEVHQQIAGALRALPGVQHVTSATIPPLSCNQDGKPIAIPGVALPSPDANVLQVNTVGPGFFETFGIPILAGRGITASDAGAAPQVAVVSESMARYYFPGGDAVGRRMDVGRGRTGGQIEIVGIAGDVRYCDLRTSPPRIAYVPALQREAEEEMTFAIRAASDPALLAPAAMRTITSIAPALVATDAKTLVAQRDERIVNERLLALLSSCFGGLALLLAGIGVYGVVAYSIAQREAELGLRMALGAGRARVLWLVIRGTLTLVVVAAALGLAAAFMTGSFLTSFLFGVGPADPWVYSGTLAVLVLVGLLAALSPTLRALRLDPVQTLRAQ